MTSSDEAPTGFRQHPVSFVRRSGRMSEAQQRAWNDVSPRMLIPVERDAASTSIRKGSTIDPAAVWGRTAPLIVEIGSGQGHAIVHAATTQPGANFLAVEVFRAGLARTMLDADQANLGNIRLVEGNAPEVLEHLLPSASVDELWIFFPDPWHKKKHTKRRLVTAEFAALAASVLRPDGLLRLATDWQDYADQMVSVLDAAPGFTRAFDGDWAPRFDGRVLTAFERKGTRAGREIRDLTYRRSA
ncbi:tRNA (guanosine(46)-N7)-methyltransferase TrmB [Microbacterium schleiferi]|uniref:tRNA (guanosine(46)-N7)-methyltransferase TrmB n=1 Tax=Microbacterium schleiferi TaxID=69362 RepID=UPI003CCA6909